MKYFLLLFITALFSFPVCADDLPVNTEPFGQWLQELRKDAASQGISAATLDDAFSDAEPDDRVIELDQKQPETTFTMEEYLARVVTQKRIDTGRELYAENRQLLEAVGKKYGVQPGFIVALWGIETSYGNITGNFGIINSLMTLAYDGRRANFFRGELMKALQIMQQEHISAAEMDGSWAGAMGQCQFMPSSFLRYAVDYDGDGKRDIWNSNADVFASIANYLHSEGWDADEGWKGDNFKVLMKWNRSRYFVTAVGTLADKIAPSENKNSLGSTRAKR